MLTKEQTILLDSKGYAVTKTDLNGAIEHNLIDNTTGLVLHRTAKLSILVNYLKGMGYI